MSFFFFKSGGVGFCYRVGVVGGGVMFFEFDFGGFRRRGRLGVGVGF